MQGRLVAGRYRLVAALGHGGMGTVWRGHDELLDRVVAVKEVRLPPELGAAEQEALRRRTMREARTAARLVHPNVVTVFDVAEDEGRPWIVMELVPSRSLAEVVATAGPLPPARVATIGLQVLAALEAAHAAGVLHRDVKPGNVLLAHDGRVVLTDFGIATLAGDASLTIAGTLLGSPGYIAPERARGEAGGPASDLWSLGATLYTAVEGRPPFDRPGPVPTLTAVVTEEPDPPVRAGPLRPALEGLLRKDPAARIGGAELSGLLRRVAETAGDRSAGPTVAAAAPVPLPHRNWPGGTRVMPVPAPVPPPVASTVPASRGWLLVAGGLVVLVLAAGLLLGWTAMTGDDGRTPGPVGTITNSPPATSPSPATLPPPAVDDGGDEKQDGGKNKDGENKDGEKEDKGKDGEENKEGKDKDGEGKGRDGDGEENEDG